MIRRYKESQYLHYKLLVFTILPWSTHILYTNWLLYTCIASIHTIYEYQNEYFFLSPYIYIYKYTIHLYVYLLTEHTCMYNNILSAYIQYAYSSHYMVLYLLCIMENSYTRERVTEKSVALRHISADCFVFHVFTGTEVVDDCYNIAQFIDINCIVYVENIRLYNIHL